MSEKKQEFHGSDLEKVEAYYGIKKEDIIPFAGNVNPLGISPLLKKSMASHIEPLSTKYGNRKSDHAAVTSKTCLAAFSNLF